MQTRLTATALLEQESRYLLVEDLAQGRVVLNNPSGRCHEGESFQETAVREAAEETGVLFVPKFFLGSYITLHTALDGKSICTDRFAFGGRIGPGDPSISRGPSILATRWLTYEEVVAKWAQHLSSAVQHALLDYRSRQMCPLNTASVVKDF
jgi:8-oxo-dGTP pyrophosphatase MutT (NUDIX family)